jgi:hypothetical protein
MMGTTTNSQFFAHLQSFKCFQATGYNVNYLSVPSVSQYPTSVASAANIPSQQHLPSALVTRGSKPRI